MTIYYSEYKVIPLKSHEYFEKVTHALACVWIVAESSVEALGKAEFFIKKNNWEITKKIKKASVVDRTCFKEDENKLAGFDRALKDGSFIFYYGYTNDLSIVGNKIELTDKSSPKLDIYFKNLKKLKNKGRCLHFDAGERCNKIINAHSIQESGLLKKISINEHVYALNRNYTNLKKNKGKLSYDKIGIGVASTFKGFCKEHDNKLFEHIDNKLLEPSNYQCFLYAYRSLCREIFVRQNAIVLIEKQLEEESNKSNIELLSSYLYGLKIGYESLIIHKNEYDKSLCQKQFNDIEFCCFNIKGEPNMAFSGIRYPDFTFDGVKLQDLSSTRFLEMITFCSAPSKIGWTYIFAWHKSSKSIGRMFLSSLASSVHENGSLQDYLFRLVFTCDNHSLSPAWWENLSPKVQNEIIEYENRLNNDLFIPVEPDYLMKGLEKISNWDVENVIVNYSNLKG